MMGGIQNVKLLVELKSDGMFHAYQYLFDIVNLQTNFTWLIK